jgi:hypothetical protein
MDKTKAEVRISSLQYRAVYSKPIIRQWGKSSELAQALLEALSEWNVSLENVTANQFPTNFAQIELSIQQFLQGRYTFRVGLDAASLSIWNPDWAEISTIKRVAAAGIQAVRQTLSIDLSNQDVVLDIHLTPQGRTRLEITSRFLPSELKQNYDDFEGCGFSLHRKNRLWHIDLSGQFSDALYLRLLRSFGATTSLDEIVLSVQQEETDCLNYLGLSIPGFP